MLKIANTIHHQSFFQKQVFVLPWFTMDAVLFLPLEGQLVLKATADLSQQGPNNVYIYNNKAKYA